MTHKKKHLDKKNRLSNLIIASITALIIAGALVFLIKYSIKVRRYEETNDAQVESHINPVSARASGFISKVLFEEHQAVEKGDTLVILDDREYKVKLQETEAVLENAKSQLEVLQAGIKVAEIGSEVNRNKVSVAQSKLWQQEQDYKRFENLLREEAVTGQAYDRVKTQYEVAQNEFKASQNSLKSNLSKVRELEAKIPLFEADIKRKQAIVEMAEIRLSYTVITSPYSGQTGRKNILEGQQIQVGQALVSIVNENQKWVVANFKETQINGMYAGQAVKIEVDAIEGRTFEGYVEAISSSTGAQFSLLPPDNSTGNFVKIIQRIPVKIKFKDLDLDVLKVGMNVTVLVKKNNSIE